MIQEDSVDRSGFISDLDNSLIKPGKSCDILDKECSDKLSTRS